MILSSSYPPDLREWLLKAEYTPILELASRKKRILSLLTRFTYDSNPVVCSNAIKASGLAAKKISIDHPEYIRNYLLRLFWLVNHESGGIVWKAPDLIGEILFHCPQFSQFFPMLISLLEIEEEDAIRFRAGTLWAIGRVSQVARDKMQPARHLIKKYVSDGNEEIRARAIWCLEQINR